MLTILDSSARMYLPQPTFWRLFDDFSHIYICMWFQRRQVARVRLILSSSETYCYGTYIYIGMFMGRFWELYILWFTYICSHVNMKICMHVCKQEILRYKSNVQAQHGYKHKHKCITKKKKQNKKYNWCVKKLLCTFLGAWRDLQPTAHLPNMFLRYYEFAAKCVY